MTESPSVYLDTIQIRYRISYLTWLRMKAWAQSHGMGTTEACGFLLTLALNHQGVTADPAVLLGLEEKDNA